MENSEMPACRRPLSYYVLESKKIVDAIYDLNSHLDKSGANQKILEHTIMLCKMFEYIYDALKPFTFDPFLSNFDKETQAKLPLSNYDKEQQVKQNVKEPQLPPIPLILFCPMCKERHIDTGELAVTPHRTHACQECGFLWAPGVIATVGVEFLPGCKNGWV